MSSIVRALRAVGRGIRGFVALIREGEDDIRQTYPDHYKPTGEQVATQASVTMGGMGHGGSGVA